MLTKIGVLYLALMVVYPMTSIASTSLDTSVVCKPMLDQIHICWHYAPSGKVIKRTRDWSLDVKVEQLRKADSRKNKSEK